MIQLRKYAVAAGTFAVALGTGFAMQNGDALAERFGSGPEPETAALSTPVPTVPVEVVLMDDANVGPVLMQPLVADATPAVSYGMALDRHPEAIPMQLAAIGGDALPKTLPLVDPVADVLPETVAAQAQAPAGAVVCDPVLTGTPSAGAMVDLILTAPCAPSVEFVLHHQGMMITGQTDAEGKAMLSLPALAQTAVFVVALPDQSGAVATLAVPEVANVDRAVLQWRGDMGLAMQVYEFGAAFGEPGHVWAEAPRDVGALAEGKGFLTTVGAESGVTEPYRAQIYTFPAGTSLRDGTIAVSVEATITEGNCGRDIAAQSIQISRGGEPSGFDLTMTMPGCDGVGDLLVLNTMFDSFAIALR